MDASTEARTGGPLRIEDAPTDAKGLLCARGKIIVAKDNHAR